MPAYLDELIAYICDCKFEDLPRQAITRAKAVVADSIAVIGAGSREEEVKALIRQVVEPDGPQLSTVIGAGIRTEPAKAGLINGTAGTFLELDEGNQFARGHPAIHPCGPCRPGAGRSPRAFRSTAADSPGSRLRNLRPDWDCLQNQNVHAPPWIVGHCGRGRCSRQAVGI